jgi:hypothetical protein
MSTPEAPEYLETLSIDQRAKLLEFIDQADAIIGDGDFDRYDRWEDCELLASALRAAHVLGFEGISLDQLFRREFGITDITSGGLGDWIAYFAIVDAERMIRVACGGMS